MVKKLPVHSCTIQEQQIAIAEMLLSEKIAQNPSKQKFESTQKSFLEQRR